MAGRFAPSPTGDLHLGNLRTAAIAWLLARSTGREFLVRMEDLDRVTSSTEHEARQLRDLAAIGVDHDGDVVRQSERFDLYEDAIDQLARRGLVFECFCTRKEIRAEIDAAPSAPHLPPGAYPGTCRELTEADRRRHLDDGRRPALRLRSPDMSTDDPSSTTVTVDDLVAGSTTGGLDDVVLRRNDGVPAYNLAVVIDDAAQGVTQVVRGDDLLSSTPRQVHLQRLLGLPTPEYAHVPLAVGRDGDRLAKRHGAISLRQLVDGGHRHVDDIVAGIVGSLGDAVRPEPGVARLVDLVHTFDLDRLPRTPWVVDPEE